MQQGTDLLHGVCLIKIIFAEGIVTKKVIKN